MFSRGLLKKLKHSFDGLGSRVPEMFGFKQRPANHRVLVRFFPPPMLFKAIASLKTHVVLVLS